MRLQIKRRRPRDESEVHRHRLRGQLLRPISLVAQEASSITRRSVTFLEIIGSPFITEDTLFKTTGTARLPLFALNAPDVTRVGFIEAMFRHLLRLRRLVLVRLIGATTRS